jgi:tRNA-specific 2-thiouridylase
VSGRVPINPFTGNVKIRYRAKGLAARINPISKDQVIVHFKEPVFGITPGQGAVFYSGQECVGGGIICDKECN